ncbi:hypothetical protein VE03_10275 [Pseudogymnoascus sp. 23342-1-I1]|nr:hypothetical protein VE03_10275 [Pseudogymnoascus sp. 23342-1-I1]
MALLDPTKTQNAQRCLGEEVDTTETKDKMNKLLSEIDESGASEAVVRSLLTTWQTTNERRKSVNSNHTRSFSQLQAEIEKIQINREIDMITGARQQMERVLNGTRDASDTAIRILSELERTDRILISCTTIFDGKGYPTSDAHKMFGEPTQGKNNDLPTPLAHAIFGKWTAVDEQRFGCRFSFFVPGTWTMPNDILPEWHRLVRVLRPKILEALRDSSAASNEIVELRD